MHKFKTRGECIGQKIENKVRIETYSSKETLRRLKLIALENGTSVSEILRVMIDDFISTHKPSSSEPETCAV